MNRGILPIPECRTLTVVKLGAAVSMHRVHAGQQLPFVGGFLFAESNHRGAVKVSMNGGAQFERTTKRGHGTGEVLLKCTILQFGEGGARSGHTKFHSQPINCWHTDNEQQN